jgi:hypothetical protein
MDVRTMAVQRPFGGCMVASVCPWAARELFDIVMFWLALVS